MWGRLFTSRSVARHEFLPSDSTSFDEVATAMLSEVLLLHERSVAFVAVQEVIGVCALMDSQSSTSVES